jgi:hypothetical protein
MCQVFEQRTDAGHIDATQREGPDGDARSQLSEDGRQSQVSLEQLAAELGGGQYDRKLDDEPRDGFGAMFH